MIQVVWRRQFVAHVKANEDLKLKFGFSLSLHTILYLQCEDINGLTINLAAALPWGKAPRAWIRPT